MTPTSTTLPVNHVGGARYQMLDIWRGVVCLVVVLEHAGVVLWSGLYEASGWPAWFQQKAVWLLTLNCGTPLFFVMSGYCIAASLESLRRKGGTPLTFLSRRFWRIVPTYWAALLFFFLVVAWLDRLGFNRLHDNPYGLSLVSPETLNNAQWFGNLTLIETWRPHLFGGASSVFTRVAWSLCYQEQFYVICVLALWLAPARVDRFLAVATVLIGSVRIMAWDSGGVEQIFSGTFPYLWHEFAVGLAVYWRLNRPTSSRERRLLEAGLVALAFVGYRSEFTSTFAAAVFGLVLIFMHRWDHVAGSLRILAPVKSCGKRSFSIYLVHLPVASVMSAVLCDLGFTSLGVRAFLVFPVAAAASVCVGWVFHRGVESHFLGQPPFLAPRTSTISAGRAIAV